MLTETYRNQNRCCCHPTFILLLFVRGGVHRRASLYCSSNQQENGREAKREKAMADASNSTNDEGVAEQQHGELMEFLTNNAQMRETARNALKQGLWAGTAAIAGGLLMGPIGGLVGGIGGSVVGFLRADEYNGVVQQLGELPERQRGHLVQTVGKVLIEAGASPSELTTPGVFQARLVEFASRRPIRDQIWRACMEVMREEGEHAANLTS